MAKTRWSGDDDDNGHDWHHGHDGHHGWEHGHDGPQFDFDFDFPDVFKIDFSDFNLKKLGKVTDYTVDSTELSITLGYKWTFSVTGSDFDVSLKSGHKLPTINSGTVDTF